MLTRIRLWSTTRQAATVGLVLLLGTAVVILVQLFRDQSLAEAVSSVVPVVAALIALMSLLATGFASWSNWRRQRRLDTIKAWNEWSDTSREARHRLTTVFGMQSITPEIGRALAEDISTGTDGTALSDPQVRRKAVNDLVVVLNGLERLSSGVRLGVYDLEMLRVLGGTIIVRQYERGTAYIEARRTACIEGRRQATAFKELERVANDLRSANLGAAKNDVDRARLDSLGRR